MITPSFAIKLATSKHAKMKGGYLPVVLQVTYKRVPRRIRLGMKCKPSQWDNNRFLTSANNGRSLNKRLDAFEDKAWQIYETHFGDRKRFDYKEFAKLFKQEEKSNDFYKIAEDFIATKKRSNTRKFYKESVISLKKIRPELDINQLTPSILIEHEQRYNSAAYMRGLRAIVNHAILTGLLDANSTPFKTAYNPIGYSFSHIKQKRKPVPLSEEEMEKLKKIDDNSLYFDLAMFSYYTFGINLWDFLQFTDKNLINDTIEFERSKTGASVVVPLNEHALNIINKYRSGERWFPICDFQNEEVAKKRCNNLRRRIAVTLRRHAKNLKIKKDITLYTMRHTSATIALKRGAPIEKISALLGHLDISTTQTYLDQFESKELKSTMALL